MLKFGFVVCCFLISLIRRKGVDKRDAILLRLGMFFTAVSDLFMIVFLNNAAGLVFFCAVQLIYRLRYTGFKRTVPVASAAAFLFAASFFTPVSISIEYRLSVFYAVCLVSAVSGSLGAYKKRRSRSALLAFAGMTLFLLCDINVALFNLFSGHDIYRLFQALIWVFYLPSQLLISLSGEAY